MNLLVLNFLRLPKIDQIIKRADDIFSAAKIFI